MSEQFKYRLQFPKNKQGLFLTKTQFVLKMNNISLSKLLNVNPRTLADWKREKFLLPFGKATLLSEKTNIKIPRSAKKRAEYWSTKKAGVAGAKETLKRHGRLGGNLKSWRKKWLDWWKSEGQFENPSPVTKPLPFKKPQKCSKLAEFVGILLGDGGISKYQIIVSLNSVDDKQYSKYVISLIKDLFEIKPKIRIHRNAKCLAITISRLEMVKWFNKEHSLPTGSKVNHQVDVPDWIKKDERYSIACTRGLLDTDGSIFTHKYLASGKFYSYKKLSFSNMSLPLIRFVHKVLNQNNIKARLSKDQKEVRVDGQDDVRRYMETLGTSNPKMLRNWKD